MLKPLQAVSGIVERRQTLPILANVLLEHKGNKLTTVATDLELQISASVDVEQSGDQSITVAAR
ncbi:MAG: DNA polymerase III subunit beta, partial [Casimicrobium sp.]